MLIPRPAWLRSCLQRLRQRKQRACTAGWQAVGRDAEPASRRFGIERGLPIDRWYIERFLAGQSARIRGRVLEVGDGHYTRRFGGDRVQRGDVLNPVAGGAETTVVGDLASGSGIPAAAFDCIILTQVLPFIYDVAGVMRTVERSLRPGGAALITVPGISQISRFDMDRWGDFWRFTDRSLGELLRQGFADGSYTIETWGNVRVAAAFLYGLCREELDEATLLHRDADYQVLLTATAIRGTSDAPPA